MLEPDRLSLKTMAAEIQAMRDALLGPTIVSRWVTAATAPVAESWRMINGHRWRRRDYRNGMICFHGPKWAILYTSNRITSVYVWFYATSPSETRF